MVPCRNHCGEVLTQEAIVAELRCNAVLKDREFEFVRLLAPDLENRPECRQSNLALTIADPNGEIEAQVFASPSIRVFGERRALKRYQPRQRLLQCKKCCALGHATKGCIAPLRCMHCAETHATSKHRMYCSKCRSEANQAAECPHPKLCRNCGGAHKADDLACPKRKRYLPVTPKERQAAQPAAEASTSAPAAGPSGQRSGTPSVRFTSSDLYSSSAR